jgi:hypothetical protein
VVADAPFQPDNSSKSMVIHLSRFHDALLVNLLRGDGRFQGESEYKIFSPDCEPGGIFAQFFVPAG